VLVTSASFETVRRLTIDGTGTLTDTGDVLASGGEPNNVFCAPGGTSGIAITRDAGELRSFTIPGLGLVDVRPLSGRFGISGQINPAGDRVFARDNFGGFVDVFDYDSGAGALGALPLFRIRILDTPTFFGMDQLALRPDGTKLYVSQPGALNVYDAGTGGLLGPIGDPNLRAATGVCFSSASVEVEVPVDVKPQSCRNPLNLGARGVVPVAILGTADVDVSQIDPATVLLEGIAPLRSDLEDVATPFEPFTGKSDCFDCTDAGPDGFADLTLKFDLQSVAEALGDLGDGACVVVEVTGSLLDGTPMRGEDVVTILIPKSRRCGIGFELVLALAPLLWARQRVRGRRS